MLPKLLLCLIAAFAQVPAVARSVTCVAIDDVPNSDGIPIPYDRIVRVPQRGQAGASRLLGKEQFKQLSSTRVNTFLRSPIDLARVLRSEALDADQKAADCLQLASEPFFVQRKEQNLKGAQSYQAFAAYLRGLDSRKLLPYLVTTNVYAKGTGGYWGFFKDHDLHIGNEAIGSGPMVAMRAMVIVFVESKINKVTVSASLAE